MKKGYHKTKSGKIAKKGLWYNIHKKKKSGKKKRKKDLIWRKFKSLFKKDEK